MMRIGAAGTAVILLAASLALVAQSDPFPPGFRNNPTLPDVRQIVESSIAVTRRHWQSRLRYSYVEHSESIFRDRTERVQSRDIAVSRTILVNGVPYERLVQHNGRPLSDEEERKQKENLDKLKKETPAQRVAELHRQDEEKTSLVQEVPKAFDFRIVGDEEVNGRAAWVLQATPRPGYRPQGKYGGFFARVEGRLWIDKQDLGWIKVDGHVIQPFSIGLFLARVLDGSHIMMEQTRLDNGIWMPERVEVRASAKIFFIKSLRIDRILTYSEYRPAGG